LTEPQHYRVEASWDPDAGVWVGTSEDVPGLVTEADTIEALMEKLRVLVPELLEMNAIVGGKVVIEELSREGTAVTILARSDEALVKLPPQEEAELLATLKEADGVEGVSAEEFFAQLRRLG
jgi:predicted RNase H-like HicB family nuclease